MLVGLTLLFVIPDVMKVFIIISTISAILVIFTWSMILFAYIAYRKKSPDLHNSSNFKMPGGVTMASITLLFLLFVLGLLSLESDTRSALFLMPIWFIFLFLIYKKEKYKECI